MGSPFDQPITQWSKGDYAGATNQQNDFTVMRAHGLAFLGDDRGNTQATATTLVAGTEMTGRGRITNAADKDYFALPRPCAGTLTVSAAPAPSGPNLDIGLKVFSPAGELLGSADPPSARVSSSQASGLDATVSAAVPGGTYYAEVDGRGRPSAAGGYPDYASVGTYSLSATGCGTPGAPAGLEVSKDLVGNAATVTWLPPTNDGGKAVTGYAVSLLATGSDPVIREFGSDASATTFTGLTPGGDYTVRVVARNPSGTGQPASRSFAMVAVAPSAPSNVVLTVDNPDQTAYLEWEPPQAQGDSAVTGYLVKVTGSNGERLPDRSFGADVRWSDYYDDLAYGTTYTFTVQARSSAGLGAPATRSYTFVAPKPPSPPRNLKATPGNRSALLTWNPPADQGTSKVWGYEFMAYNAAGSQVGFTDVVENRWLMGTRSQPEWLVFDLVNGRQYKFSVRALSNDGSSVKAWTGYITPRA